MHHKNLFCLKAQSKPQMCMGDCSKIASTPFGVVCSGHWIRPEIPQQRNYNFVVDIKRIIPSLQHYLHTSPEHLGHKNSALRQVKLGLWLQGFGRGAQHMGWCSLVLFGIQQKSQVPVLILLMDTSWPANFLASGKCAKMVKK